MGVSQSDPTQQNNFDIQSKNNQTSYQLSKLVYWLSVGELSEAFCRPAHPLLTHRKSVVLLEAMAVGSDSRFALVDKLYMALAWGYGHGACHMLFFYLSLLPLAAGGGTLYTEACPHMSFFLAGALSALAFGMILPSVMLVSLDGYSSGNRLHVAFAPAMHVTAAVLVSAAGCGPYADVTHAMSHCVVCVCVLECACAACQECVYSTNIRAAIPVLG